MTKALLLILSAFLWTANAHAQAPFYQGKTVRVIIGTPPGNLYDLWGRLIVEHMGKHIPGNPSFIVQNMPGAGHVVAVNHLYSNVKPDGLTIIGSVIPSLYLNQIIGRSEIQFDWAKFSWIGSPARGSSQMYMRADSPYKTIEDVRTAKEPPKCGATGVTGPDSYLPKLMQETVGAKVQHRHRLSRRNRYRSRRRARRDTLPRLHDRGVFRPRALSYLAQEWLRASSLPDRQDARCAIAADSDCLRDHGSSTKQINPGRGLATVLLGADGMGRPMFGPPGLPADR